jgi:hypothetical protein
MALVLAFGVFAALVLVGLVVLRWRRRRRRQTHLFIVHQKQNPVDLTPFLAKAGVDLNKAIVKVPREIPREYFSQLEELGKGAFGIVYNGLIRDPSGLMPEFPVATKVILKTADENASSELLFEVCCGRFSTCLRRAS